MDYKNSDKFIRNLESKIASLPNGSIAKKNINGKDYYYHRIMLDGKRKEKYIMAENVQELRRKIEERRKLEQELKQLKKLTTKPKNTIYNFKTNIIIGSSLHTFSSSVKNYKKRECFQILYNYLYGDIKDKVLILYGLRRTGKTTLIRQALLDMNEDNINKSAFIQITTKDTLSNLNSDLKQLQNLGYKYIFIDEVTLLSDFIEGAALFSDIFVASGMKIILSGNDSLGFKFSLDEELYDRAILLHTTFIPYREFENVLGIKGIDEYIRYGGTMSLSGIDYNNSIFSTSTSTSEYVDTAIARNIQHSLKYYQYEGHFRSLEKLYEKNELTNVINRVIEDINHRFTLDVLTKDFKSNDLSISAKNLRKDRTSPTDILDKINIKTVTNNLRKLLTTLNKQEQSIELEEYHVIQIKEYLELLDLIVDIDIISLPNIKDTNKKTVITQPGLRYAQATSLISSLLEDETFFNLSLIERKAIEDRILSGIMGRMTENIILLETKLARPNMQVFQLQFAIGEFDMVIFDKSTLSCQIYEIKHNKERNQNQYRHLIDTDKCRQTEHRYGKITKKAVLYRGDDYIENDIEYINIEKYLCNL